MSKKNISIESVLDLNSSNIWSIDENEIANLWEQDRKDPDFINSEEKFVNLLRTAFEVVHFNPDDKRDVERFNTGQWSFLTRGDKKRGIAAIRRKHIRNLNDLSYENIKHVTAPTLLDLIDRNFGGGWDSIPLSVKDIIESCFDISTSTLPASRMHAPGGTLERKVALGFEVLEVSKGTWTEAIFAKKKEPLEKIRIAMEEQKSKYDKNDESLDDEDEDLPDNDQLDEDEDDEVDENDETFYSSYSPEADVKEDDEEAAFGEIDED